MVLKVKSEKLRQLRRYAGLSQAQLAEAAQTTQMTIYRLEKEDTVIRLPTAFKLSRALGCRMEDLTEQIPRLPPKKPPVKRNYKHGCILSGQKIKDLRKGLGWTQEYLAEKADICNTNYVSLIERNGTGVKRVNAERLAAALGVDLNEIMVEDEN